MPRGSPRTRATWSPNPTLAVEGSADEAPTGVVSDRYERLGFIGRGGMGEVWRVRDRVLNRVLAMKVMRPGAGLRASTVARFVEEAQATAQLQHPGIVPVHDLGQLDDGRWYFTMKEVEGRTLRDALQGRQPGRLRPLLEAFRKVCEAVAHAHARGVTHRDLKPENVMLGDFGEVLVLDWGLVKVRDAPEPEAEPVVTDRSREGVVETQVGQVAGTPGYMSPEQARGAVDEVGPAADVYALGTMLHEILHGQVPYAGKDTAEVLAAVQAGLPVEEEVSTAPAALVALARTAMATAAADRPTDAGVVADAVAAWLEGSARREQAEAQVESSDAAGRRKSELRERAEALRQAAEDQLGSVAPWAPVDVKRVAWALQEQAGRLEREADLEEVRQLQALRAALNLSPELESAHARLAAHYRARHAAAEAEADTAAATRFEALLRAHDQGEHRGYLCGEGLVSLATTPAGARVDLYTYVVRDRRLVPELRGPLGRTPLRRVPIPHGSHLLVLRAAGCCPVRYPVSIRRQEHWDGVGPGGAEPVTVRLPRAAELGSDDVFVPPGWFVAGGDRGAVGSMPATRAWCDGFVIGRFPVTNAQFIEFLDALVRAGRPDEALRAAPRERGGTVGELGALIYGRDAGGYFHLRPDAEGDEWLPGWPVTMVDWHGALAYANWRAARDGLPWRLPAELEWEKAARGVDGRPYPFGDYLDPTWASMHSSHSGPILLSTIEAFPGDESPYGARGLAGNTRDWCLDRLLPGGPWLADGRVVVPRPDPGPGDLLVCRGGDCGASARDARATFRMAVAPSNRVGTLGFRLARTL